MKKIIALLAVCALLMISCATTPEYDIATPPPHPDYVNPTPAVAAD